MHYTLERYHQMDQALFSDCTEREIFLRLLKEYGKTVSVEVQNNFKVGMDIGSVSGFYLAAFLGFGMNAIAVNNDAQALHYLREEAFYSPYIESGRGKDVQLLKADMGKLPVENSSIDLISMMTGTFSHVQRGNHESVLKECARVLGKERVLIISDWNIAADEQNFLGLYSEEEQEQLRVNHYGYPHLLDTLQKVGLTPRFTSLHSQKRMYTVLSTRN
ncbi:MAG: class I SAM-dependent methyltransferase [Nanoarchaeota archaeon]|nr:class I SAM-dependent methyltransferase [Nanoarchaeota archaeon]